MVCIDPFGGVSLGGHDCGLMGVQHLAVELEPRFHTLALDNIALWQRRYGHLPQWVTPIALQGDSRQLREVIEGQGELCVASPPWQDQLINHDTPEAYNALRAKVVRDGRGHGGKVFWTAAGQGYGATPGNLGNLPPGSLDLACSSPPYADGCRHTGGADPQPHHIEGGTIHHVHYGESAANLGNIAPGQVEACVDLSVSSPPYGDQQVGTGEDGRVGWRGYTDFGGGLPSAAAQLAAMPMTDTFWSAARQIVVEVFALLKPGGHAVWVTKNYIRDGAEVPFTDDWIRLCTRVGFVLLHHHHASLVETHGTQQGLFGGETVQETRRESFFRRLARKKTGVGIHYESVLCMVKPTGEG